MRRKRALISKKFQARVEVLSRVALWSGTLGLFTLTGALIRVDVVYKTGARVPTSDYVRKFICSSAVSVGRSASEMKRGYPSMS